MGSAQDIYVLRVASEEARDDYMFAQFQLLQAIEGAQRGMNEWPTAADYEHTRALGERATKSLRLYLDAIHVPRSPQRSSLEKMRLIERLSRSESRWQPTPEAWLRQQDKKS